MKIPFFCCFGFSRQAFTGCLFTLPFFRYAVLCTFLTLGGSYLLKLKAAEGLQMVDGIPVNTDEALVGDYRLPDPLVSLDGTAITTAQQWFELRRPELMEQFETWEYGKASDRSEVSCEVFDEGTLAYDGKALRKQVTLYFSEDRKHKADLVVYVPAESKEPVPLLLHISFFPNHLTVADPGVRKGMRWDREGKLTWEAGDWKVAPLDVERFVSNGLGIATIYYGDIEPDFGKGILYGIRGYYLDLKQHYPADDEWGAIAAWSWGLSAAMDYLQTDALVAGDKVAVTGFSRLGKTALWTGVTDERFAMVIPCLSGEGGAALSRRNFGETIAHMVSRNRFYYWFCENRQLFAQDPSSSPVDAHQLLALVAPRPLLLITGETDDWSDAKGEFLSAVAAGPVYELLGKQSLGTDVLPEVGTPILHDMGYVMHAAGHTVLPEDWDLMIEFMKTHLCHGESTSWNSE